MKIRPIEKNDVEEWLRMRSVLWPGGKHEHLHEITEFFAGRPVHIKSVYVAEKDSKKLVGFIELNTRNYAEGSDKPEVPYIEGWYVDADYRNKNTGRSLVEAAEKWALSLGYNELASYSDISNVNSIKAHKALGFKEVDRNVSFLKRLC